MKRMFWAFALACTPVLVAAQSTPNDRLTLDLYLEYETVSDPQLSPDGAQIIYTRGWIDKMNDKRESSLWIMNADGSRNRFLVRGSSARWSPTGDRIVYTAQGEPKGSQIFVRYMDAEGATSQITRVDKSPSSVAWSPDGTAIAFAMNVESEDTLADQDAEARPRAPSGPRRRASSSGSTIARTAAASPTMAIGTCSRCRPPAARRGSSPMATGITTASSGRPTASRSCSASLRVPDADYQWRESEIYAVDVDTRRDHAADDSARDPTATRRSRPTASASPTPAYDWSTDTWQDSKLYVMNIDGSNPRLVSGDWDRSPQSITWKADGTGVYFTAQDQGSQNLYFLPLAGTRADEVQPVTKGTHMLTTSSIAEGQGRRRADLAADSRQTSSPSTSPSPQQIKQLTAVNDDILDGQEARRGQGDLVHRRPTD